MHYSLSPINSTNIVPLSFGFKVGKPKNGISFFRILALFSYWTVT